jgi:signal transduction histidine kinase
MRRMAGVFTPVEARQRALMEALPDLLLRLGADGTYLELGGDLSRLANPPEKVLGANVRDLLPAEIAAQLMRGVASALETGELATEEYRLRTHLGVERDFELRIARVAADEALVIVRDVTDARQAMRELKESRARIVAAGDAARRRIERNLHDGAQQRLVTVSLHLHLISRRLESAPDAVPALLEAAQTELALALEEIRELVRGLHPRVLSDHGLGPALRALAERALVPVELVELPEERFAPSLEAAIYYVCAEALANAAKHAAASVVTVRVARECGCTIVEVADDGVGGADPNGSGLRGLADRVAAFGGQFAVSSVPGAGTALRAEFPARAARV